MNKLDKFQIASYVIAALLALLILGFHFLPLLFAVILTFVFIEKTNSLILWTQQKLFCRNTHCHTYSTSHHINLVSTILIIGIVCSAIFLISLGIYQFIHGNHIEIVLDKLSAIISSTKNSKDLPDFIVSRLPDNLDEIKSYSASLLREYGSTLTRISKNSLTVFAYIILGIIIGAMLSFHYLKHHGGNRKTMPAFKTALIARIATFKNSFENVFIAQAKISFVNTLLTAVYLLVLLPILDVHLPLRFTVLAITFVIGLIPVVGNLISNTVIIILSLGASLYVAAGSLLFLVVIHKLEYFLNARIIGSQIDSSAWELLLVMILAERIFGIGGIVAAPIYYAYLKHEMKTANLI